MTASIWTRIILRYLSGVLVAKALIDTDMGQTLMTDPDLSGALDLALGVIAAGISEGWYMLARRMGWSK